MTDLENLNRIEPGEFIDLLGGVYEHSPWVAERATASRPFSSRDELLARLSDVVETASDEEKLTLIRAHPDLAGKLARAGALTPESVREQAGLGLDRLGDEEYDRFSRLNTAYRERFGFPFIICARLSTRPGVLQAFETRLTHDRETEIAEALRQIHLIARLRVEDLVS